MKERKMIIFLLTLSTVCVLFLCSADFAYKKAANIFNVRLYKVINNMFDIKSNDGDTEKVFLENFKIKNVGGETYYISKKINPGVIIFKAKGPGLWSQIEILLSVYPSYKKLYGLRVISQNETPGLGGRISEIAYQKQFSNKSIVPDLRIVKFASKPNEVDAVTGATATSDSLQDIINNGIKRVEQVFPKKRTEE
ncbi:MAG: FMN-binding protein [bacterium]|nr:FMN-binding protein [bacterium]